MSKRQPTKPTRGSKTPRARKPDAAPDAGVLDSAVKAALAPFFARRWASWADVVDAALEAVDTLRQTGNRWASEDRADRLADDLTFTLAAIHHLETKRREAEVVLQEISRAGAAVDRALKTMREQAPADPQFAAMHERWELGYGNRGKLLEVRRLLHECTEELERGPRSRSGEPWRQPMFARLRERHGVTPEKLRIAYNMFVDAHKLPFKKVASPADLRRASNRGRAS